MCATDKRPWRGIFAFSVAGMMGLNPLSLVMAEVKPRWCKDVTLHNGQRQLGWKISCIRETGREGRLHVPLKA
ncbi:hypothetical protein BDD12DRAFT_866438 [Trichophaea hybrida]|nr:hypothetical protein BDD12DRAFT_866438 [Trichophaea hybrida]